MGIWEEAEAIFVAESWRDEMAVVKLDLDLGETRKGDSIQA